MLRWVATWCTLASLCAFQRPSHATQVPLAAQTGPIDHSDPLAHWPLNEPPNVNSTGHLVFETVNSLLQHWPNTRMRNGHNIVPSTIPPGTLLYHGTGRKEIPAGHEWVALDPEHATPYCNRFGEEECWLLTLITTRPLKVLYFDGSSGARTSLGTLDTEDLVAWGEIRPDRKFDDEQKVQHLCAWSKEYGVDGFVRMEVSFEMALCSFASGISVVSFLNIAHNDEIFGPIATAGFMRAGSWHNRFPGETRVRIDLSGLVSFYDTDLAPSLVSARFGQERWDHRLQNISKEDTTRVTARLQEILTRPVGHASSGIDWMTLIHVITDRYTERLELVQYLVNSTDNADPESLLEYAKKTQVELRVMLRPYILSNITLLAEGIGAASLNWARPVFRLCATTHIRGLDTKAMTDSEKLLLNAVRETTREICRVITGMWTSGVLAGIDERLDGRDSELDIEAVRVLMKTWKNDINGLMQWLDWNMWVKCRPACGPEEMCYLTTWPIGFPLDEVGPTIRWHSFPVVDDWKRPQPRCVRVISPYTDW